MSDEHGGITQVAVIERGAEEERERQEVERAAEALAETAGIDPDQVDLGLPLEYATRVMARQRLNAAREALLLRRLAAANKPVNEKRYEELRQMYVVQATLVALIDRYHPGAKALAIIFANEVVVEEERKEDKPLVG